MNFDEYPLSFFEVDCDGSACASKPSGPHVHPPEHDGVRALARVVVRNRERVGYRQAEGITSLVMLGEQS